MENAGEEEGIEESSRQNEEDSSLQEEGHETAEGSRDAAPLDPEEMTAPRSDDPVLWSEPDLDEEARGYNAHMSETPPQEEEEEEEEEELTILDMDHPLDRTYQDGLAARLRGYLEGFNSVLDEKRAVLQADDQYFLEACTWMDRKQKNLTTKKNKLEGCHCSLAEAKTKYLEVKDQLEETKRRYSITDGQYGQIKAEVSKLQTESDKAMQHLIFTQEVSEDLHSKLKTMSTVRRKVGTEKAQAEEQKLKKDLYIERLTKNVERVTQQIAMYEAQATAQREDKCAVKEALYESETVMEMLFMAHKHLLQQWNRSLMTIKRQDEAYSAMQEALRSVEHQVFLLDRESEGYKKSISGLQEKNEALTKQLNWCETDFTTHKKLISQKQAEQEALLAHYNSCSRTLQETEKTLAMCTKDIGTYQTEVNNQRKQMEKESSLRLQLQGEIMTQMQQKLAHNKAAQDSQHLIAKMSTPKKAKIFHLEQLENELSSVRLESQQVDQHVGLLALTQEALDEELSKCEELLTKSETQMSSLVQIIKEKGQTITMYNCKLSELNAKTGREDLSLHQFKVEEITTQVQELVARVKKDQQLWLKQQLVLVMLTQKTEAKRKEMSKLQTEYISMQQKKIRLESQNELEEQEEAEQKNILAKLNRDLVKLRSLVSEKKQLSQILEQDNALMESEFLQRFKDAEWESVKMQMDLEKVQEENERLLNALVETEQQIVLWEKKTEILKETFSTVDTGQDEIKKMKDEIHRMEMRIEQLKKQQESLKRESGAAVETWDNIMLRKQTMARTAHRKDIKAELKRCSQGLQRNIWETCKHVKECEQVYRELQKTQDALRHQLLQEKKQIIELFNTADVLDLDLVNLQDTKETDFAHLVTLQNRSKKLRAVREGSYKASSSSETVAAAIQIQTEHLQAVRTILHQQCEDVPEHQGALRKVLRALAARTQVL